VRWKQRFLQDRLSVCTRVTRTRSGKRTPKMEAKILEWTRRPPRDVRRTGARVSCRAFGIHHMMVPESGNARDFNPTDRALHDVRRSRLEQKAADVIGLYVKPPQHAVVFCVDEKTSVQALDRLDPVLPLAPAERSDMDSNTTVTALFLCTPR